MNIVKRLDSSIWMAKEWIKTATFQNDATLWFRIFCIVFIWFLPVCFIGWCIAELIE